MPVVLLREDCRKCGEQDIEVSVRDRHVKTNREADRGPSEHLCRTNDRESEELCGAEVAGQLRAQFIVACLCAQFLGFAFKDHRC